MPLPKDETKRKKYVENLKNQGFQKGHTVGKGVKHPWTTERNKINNPVKKGSEHYLWVGGGPKYWAKQTKIRDDNTCQICGLKEPDIMVVDHIKPKSIFPELQFEINNLVTLCPNCHARKTQRERRQKYDKQFYA
jgi:hypothetical protein